MDWLRRNPGPGAVLILFVLAAGLDGWLGWRYRDQSRRALLALEQKKQEREWLAGRSPAPTEANERAMAADLANTSAVLAALRVALRGEAGAGSSPPPARPLDLYFDLASFVEQMRTLATQAQVQLKPDEKFGFASHANEGPEAGLGPAVHHQRRLAQYLLEALFEARPRTLVGLRRERPLPEAQGGRRSQPPDPVTPAAVPVAAAGEMHGDFFELHPGLSVRTPGRVDSEAFRVEFTGQTGALRAFLNTLAGFKHPVIVRSVEVEPLAAETEPADSMLPSAGAGAPVPLVRQNLSRFVVVVECVSLVPPGPQSGS